MRYKIIARDNWDKTLQDRFGDCGSIHELTDTEVVEAIIQFGRCQITDYNDLRVIDFQSGYD